MIGGDIVMIVTSLEFDEKFRELLTAEIDYQMHQEFADNFHVEDDEKVSDILNKLGQLTEKKHLRY